MQRAGYEVTVVATAAEALNSVTRGVQLVLLDLGLPDMDGLQACRELRALRIALPILVVSARSSESDLVLALNAGADDYLVKPFRTQELLARVRALLRRAAASDVLIAGDIAVDPAQFAASVNGMPLALTPKELEILVMLIRSAGRIVDREQLLRSLWQNSLPAHSKSLDMHLSSLRRKLRDANSLETITTVRSRGFVLSH
jgi:DNA-binding response OmpR family regulator